MWYEAYYIVVLLSYVKMIRMLLIRFYNIIGIFFIKFNDKIKMVYTDFFSVMVFSVMVFIIIVE